MHKSLIAAAAWLLPFTCSAQSYTEYDKNTDKLVLSNALLATDNINPLKSEDKSALGWQLDAHGALVALGEGQQYKLLYGATLNQWQQQPASLLQDNSFFQGEIAAHGRWHLSQAWQLNGSAGYQHTDQMPGTGLSRLREDIVATDSRKYSDAQLGLSYGHDASARRLSLNYHHGAVRYSGDNAYLDEFELDQTTLTGTIAFRLSAATRFILELENQQDDYLAVTRFDSDKNKVLAGIEWDYSGLTRIKALVGAYKRETEQRPDTDGSAWQLSLNYRPREDTGIRIESSQDSVAGDSELASDSRMRSLLLELTYRYSQLWQWGLLLNTSETRFEEAVQVRFLDEKLARVWVALALQQQHQFRLSLQYKDNQLSDNTVDYQQSQIMASWQYRF
ncbi:hypothetical protein [Lacimicrobium sp. SS2-24]|uniref:hypothetical protein n=1 Tax=Lacimicrobium sp. SS2-24 TaxID=2005569 RepID=UPI000B4A78D1|nr:hypothetical protein [Lacimicrobium sp. SS2-24]